MATTNTPFGTQIRAARRAQDLTQFQLGRAIGRSPAYICCVERGYVLPDSRDKKRLAQALKFPQRRLKGGT